MTHTQVGLQHDGDLDLQHGDGDLDLDLRQDGDDDLDIDLQRDGYCDDKDDLDHNVNILSSLQHLVDVMEARIKQVSFLFQILLDPI